MQWILRKTHFNYFVCPFNWIMFLFRCEAFLPTSWCWHDLQRQVEWAKSHFIGTLSAQHLSCQIKANGMITYIIACDTDNTQRTQIQNENVNLFVHCVHNAYASLWRPYNSFHFDILLNQRGKKKNEQQTSDNDPLSNIQEIRGYNLPLFIAPASSACIYSVWQTT